MKRQRRLSMDYAIGSDSESEHFGTSLLGAYYDDPPEGVVFLTVIAEDLDLRRKSALSARKEAALIHEILATDIHETLHYTMASEKWNAQPYRRMARWAESDEEVVIEELVGRSMEQKALSRMQLVPALPFRLLGGDGV